MARKPKQGATWKIAAAELNVSAQTLLDWQRAGWLVQHEDKSIDVAATSTRVAELRNPFVGGKPNRGITPKCAPVRADAGERARTVTLNTGEVVSYEEARRRNELAKAELNELEVAKMRGDLISRADAERVYCDVIAKARANLEAIPNRCAELLVGQTDAAVVRAMLTREIENALAAVAGETLT